MPVLVLNFRYLVKECTAGITVQGGADTDLPAVTVHDLLADCQT
jgi:hypothetical protein